MAKIQPHDADESPRVKLIKRQLDELRADMDDARSRGAMTPLAAMGKDLRKLEAELLTALMDAAKVEAPAYEDLDDEQMIQQTAQELASLPPGLLDRLLRELVGHVGPAPLTRAASPLRLV